MNPLRRFWFLSICSSLLACAADGGGSTTAAKQDTFAGKVLRKNEGLIFETGEVVTGGLKFNQVDLYAVENGAALQLKTGGATSVENAPINWFVTGGVAKTFPDGLADVPFTKPTEGQVDFQNKAVPLTGFVAEGFVSPGYGRGTISASTETTVTIDYEFIPE